jgi:dolichol-phosphate mannosyltransferase
MTEPMHDDSSVQREGRYGPRLAIVVPMYNERIGAEACVRALLEVIPTLAIPTRLIVVDDGSCDGTGELLDKLVSGSETFTVVHKPNGGYGSAISLGARTAFGTNDDYVLFMDCDLTNPPEHVERFVPFVLRGVDLIKASRFSDGGDMRDVPWQRRIVSIAGNLVARALFRVGIADCTNGFRAIRTKLYLDMPLTESGFSIILQELYWAKRFNASIASVPTSLSSRSKVQRATSFPYSPKVIWSYLKFALRACLIRYRPHQR